MTLKGASMRRSLHDFVWLRSALAAMAPGTVVPPITAEATAGDSAVLERFVARVLEHDALRDMEVLKAFALAPPSEFGKWQDEFAPPRTPLHLQVRETRAPLPPPPPPPRRLSSRSKFSDARARESARARPLSLAPRPPPPLARRSARCSSTARRRSAR